MLLAGELRVMELICVFVWGTESYGIELCCCLREVRVMELNCAVGWGTESYGIELCCCLRELRVMELNYAVGWGTENSGTDLNSLVCRLANFALFLRYSRSANSDAQRCTVIQCVTLTVAT